MNANQAKLKRRREGEKSQPQTNGFKDDWSVNRKKLHEKTLQNNEKATQSVPKLPVEKDHVGLYQILSKDTIEERTVLEDGSIRVDMVEVKKIRRIVEQDFTINRDRKTERCSYEGIYLLKSEIEKHLELIKFSMKPEKLAVERRFLDKVERDVIRKQYDMEEGLVKMKERFKDIKKIYSSHLYDE